ncbi:hypothetical protein niasHT_037617 [Heterodera trifolii]|uniref:Uncharacterized protein n=1 Tax=Heterodera trifolii TaxID=157864 RepID=A0ABD2IPM7_9BILA
MAGGMEPPAQFARPTATAPADVDDGNDDDDDDDGEVVMVTTEDRPPPPSPPPQTTKQTHQNSSGEKRGRGGDKAARSKGRGRHKETDKKWLDG